MDKIKTSLFLLFIVNCIIFSIFLPVWEGFDEPSHFAYIQFIAENKKIPNYKNHVSEQVSETFKKLPLNQNLASYGVIYSTFWAKNKSIKNSIINTKQTRKKEDLTSMTIYETQHPPLAYIIQVPVYLLFANFGFYSSFTALRLFNCLIVIVGAFVFIQSLKLLSGDSFLQVLSLIFLNINAMNYIHLIRISNESLVYFFYSFIFYYLIRIIKNNLDSVNYIVLGVIYGLGMITKAFFFSTLPVLFFFYAFLLIKNKYSKRIFILIVLSLVIMFLLSSWYYIGNLMLKGDFTGLKLREDGFIPNRLDINKILTVNWIKYYYYLFFNFAITLGWNMAVKPSSLFFKIFLLIISCSFFGYLKQFFLKTKIITKPSMYLLLISVSNLIIFLLAIGYTNYRYFYPRFELLGGWYLVSLLPFITFIISYGYSLLFTNIKMRLISLFLLFSMGIFFQIILYYHYLIPFYYGL